MADPSGGCAFMPSHPQPVDGHSLGHFSTTRIFLRKGGEQRTAKIYDFEKESSLSDQDPKSGELGEPEMEPSMDSEVSDEVYTPRWSRLVTEERWPDERPDEMDFDWDLSIHSVGTPPWPETPLPLVEQFTEFDVECGKVVAEECSSFRCAELSDIHDMVSEIEAGEATENASFSPVDGGDQLAKKPKRGCRRKSLIDQGAKQQPLPVAKPKLRSGAPIFVPRALTESNFGDTKTCSKCGSSCALFCNFCGACGAAFPSPGVLSGGPSSQPPLANPKGKSSGVGKASSKPAFMLRMIQ